MAFYDTTWYCNFGNGTSTGHYAVAQFAASHSYSAGQLIRQLTAPVVGSERVFVCIVAGTSGTEPSWTVTRGAKNTSTTPVFQECTGASAVNGDQANTATWAQAKAIGTPTLGAIIQRNNGASYQICSTAGTLGASEPSFSDTAGVTTSDGTTTWISLGAVSNFTGGQAPHARLANACASTWFAAGNTVYVGDNHAESQTTAITITPTSAYPAVGRILCHNHSSSYPPASSDLTTGATISTTAAAATITYSGGSTYLYGLAFKAGVGVSTGVANILLTPAAGSWNYFDNCSFWLADSAAANVSTLQLTNTGAMNSVIFNNTTIKLATTAQSLSPGNGSFLWQNTGQVLVSGSSIPVSLLIFGLAAGNTFSSLVLEALDLSQLTGNLFGFNLSNQLGSLLVKDCKLNASMTITQPSVSAFICQLIRSDSGATGYLSSRYAYEGTESTETSITRVGGAVDPTSQAQSRKIITTANSQWLRPFKAEPYAIWNAVTGSNVTVTVYGTINAGSLPNNDDIWIEIEYLGSASFPVGTIVNTTKASLLAANAAVSSDGSTWNGGGSGGGWSPFKLTTTLSSPQPGMAGYLYARVRAAKASTTYYIDPKIVLS